MLRRCKSWDYCAPRIYMISITLADRSLPLLGKLVIDSPKDAPPESVCAHIEPSVLGSIVQDCWAKARYEKAVKALEALMEKREELRRRELMEAVRKSDHTYEEILCFIRG